MVWGAGHFDLGRVVPARRRLQRPQRFLQLAELLGLLLVVAEKLDGDFGAEVRSLPHVLPNMVYRDSLVFWSGAREVRVPSGNMTSWPPSRRSLMASLSIWRVLSLRM